MAYTNTNYLISDAPKRTIWLVPKSLETLSALRTFQFFYFPLSIAFLF
jgi:hypothetical protein